ncbi:MAG: hypothetical protein ACTSVA_07035 [Candidatus Njordarchaeales archaeon]
MAEHIGENVRRVMAKLRILKNLNLVDSPEKGKYIITQEGLSKNSIDADK